MDPSFREIVELLNRHEVEYIVFGGVAAVIQGAPITTFDLDTLIRISDDNADRIIPALEDLDACYRVHTAAVVPGKKDILAGVHLLLMSGPDHWTYQGPLATVSARRI